MFLIGISARRWFSHWPEMAKELGQNSFKGTLFEYRKHSGEVVVPAISFADKALGGAPPTGAAGKMLGLICSSFYHF